MSTQDPYGSQDQPREQRTGSSADGPSWQSSAPSGPPAEPDRSGYPSYPDRPGAPGGYAGGRGELDRPAPRNGIGIAALVLGVLALLSGFIVVGGVLGLVAIVLGIIGSRRAKRGEATNRGMAITGIVLGALGIIGAVLAIVFFGFIGSRAANCSDLIAQGAPEDTINQCLADQLGVPADQLDG